MYKMFSGDTVLLLEEVPGPEKCVQVSNAEEEAAGLLSNISQAQAEDSARVEDWGHAHQEEHWSEHPANKYNQEPAIRREEEGICCEQE